MDKSGKARFVGDKKALKQSQTLVNSIYFAGDVFQSLPYIIFSIRPTSEPTEGLPEWPG